ncbi:MAG: DNA repair protein RecO [Bacteroidales bacterium]|nr:DNA repair protein RecO [Bacteroidales bacterium]MCM1414316.1 DNA repair protein RecO [bacterium]MCM1422196.1 DNA repair protein RecO [bacterium]
MQEVTELTGMVLKAEPMGDYDRRVVLLTKERGKIAAFARGARKPNSKLVAATNPFCFGTFKLYEGRTSYNLTEADISNYFEGLREDYESAFYGMYFLEVMDYFTRENNDEKEFLKLLYQSLRALMHEGLSHMLVRYVFEIKAVVINGEFPGIPEGEKWDESTRYAVSYIASSGIEKLYTFTVTPQVLAQLGEIAATCRAHSIDRPMKSLEIVENL